MDCETTEKEYTASTVERTGARKLSKSAYDYLHLKANREGGQPVAGVFSNTKFRYGDHTTPTTRRTSHDSDDRSTY